MISTFMKIFPNSKYLQILQELLPTCIHNWMGITFIQTHTHALNHTRRPSLRMRHRLVTFSYDRHKSCTKSINNNGIAVFVQLSSHKTLVVFPLPVDQVSTMFHDTSIGNAVNIVLVKIIYLESEEVGKNKISWFCSRRRFQIWRSFPLDFHVSFQRPFLLSVP